MTKKEQPVLSTKNTKEQILAAYNEALEKLQQVQISSPKEEKQQQDNIAIIKKATGESADSILKQLSELKLNAIKQVDVLSDSLLVEFDRLSHLKKAVLLEQRHLEELYGIKEASNTLAALLKANQVEQENFKHYMNEEKSKFAQEMASKTTEWQIKQDQLESEHKERKEMLTKIRKREEEEYNYNLEMMRRKDANEYEAQKLNLEKELLSMREDCDKREAAIAAKEALLAELQAKVAAFPEELVNAIDKAESVIKSELDQKFKFSSELREKEYEASCKLYEQSITYLEQKVQEQDSAVKEFSEKANNATKQIEAIACRALDVSSKRFAYPSNAEVIATKVG